MREAARRDRPTGARHAPHDLLEQLGDAESFLGAHEQDVVLLGADEVVQLLLAALRLGAGEIDLVEDRDDLEPRVEREEQIRERLRLDPLRRVDDEDGALACGERARDFVREVDVSRRVDEVELVRLAAVRGVGHAYGVELDRDAALALEVERVEHLRLHLALLQHARGFDQPVGERRLAMVDVRDDAEITDVIELQRRSGSRGRGIRKYNGLDAVSVGWMTVGNDFDDA